MQTIRLRVWQLVLAVGLATLLLGVALGHFLLPGKPRGREIDLGDGVKVYVSKSAEPQLEARRDSSEAMTNVRAAIPAIEAYAADHNGYARMTLAAVRKYDARATASRAPSRSRRTARMVRRRSSSRAPAPGDS